MVLGGDPGKMRFLPRRHEDKVPNSSSIKVCLRWKQHTKMFEHSPERQVSLFCSFAPSEACLLLKQGVEACFIVCYMIVLQCVHTHTHTHVRIMHEQRTETTLE